MKTNFWLLTNKLRKVFKIDLNLSNVKLEFTRSKTNVVFNALDVLNLKEPRKISFGRGSLAIEVR